MWTLLLIFASSILLAECQTFEPIYPPLATSIIECMVPGEYEAVKKRSELRPARVPVPEPILTLQLLPGRNPDDCWELPPIEVKPPYIPLNDAAFNISLYRALDAFLGPSTQTRMIASNTPGALIPTDPNGVFGLVRLPFEIPDSLLEGFNNADVRTIERYVADLEFGQCDITPQVKQRPDFYYPRFQVQGVCDGRECGLPMTDDHEFNQRCRPFIGGDDQIYIEGMRWDCCHSYNINQQWDYICGWRRVRFPVVHKCECSCDPTGQ